MKLGWLLCLVCACKGSGQSFSEGMAILCDAPSTHDAAYFKTNLTNAEVIRMFAAIGDSSPSDRVKRMREAVAKAGLTSCAMLDQMAAVTEHAPKVAAAPGAIDIDGQSPVVIATPTGIVIDGKAILQITNGQPAPDEIQGLGMMLPRVTNVLTERVEQLAKQGPIPRLELVVDPKLSYKLLVQLIYSAKKAGFRDFGIVVAVGTATKAIPITLPDPAPHVAATTPPLGLILTIVAGKLLVWSTSGEEGTLVEPKVSSTNLADIAKPLADIATRHAGDKQIIVMAEGTTPMQQVADALALVRQTADGHELFPTILLSAGIE
jgi:biopolymer transport protein ExbD